jgi:glyoxylase-like metal-dependent hydrolase (beta-lactamase superfamily II)
VEGVEVPLKQELDVTTIDTGMHDEPGITGAFVVRGERTALVETGPKSTATNVVKGLTDAGVETVDVIAVTHVHLDHAGAAGTIARLFPSATVAVHEVGAPHLVDPSKLWSSAARIYGDAMEAMWGGIDPLPPDRIRTLADGDVIDLGGRTLRAVATPGHAFHHHAFLDEGSGTAFVGDALGVRLPDLGILRPATPPPEFDLELTIASVERIAELAPERVVLTHFGPSDVGASHLAPAEACEQAIDAFRTWERWVRAARAEAGDLDGTAAAVERRARGEMESALNDDQIARLEKTTNYRMNTWGYMRYLDKSEQG